MYLFQIYPVNAVHATIFLLLMIRDRHSISLEVEVMDIIL
jgi:hypothetical protein